VISLLFDTSDYGVYVATRNDTGDVVYVGCSWKGMKKRLNQHINDLKANRHDNSGLQKFWNAKGLTFTHVVKCLPIERLVLAFEKAYGAQYDFKSLVNFKPLGEKLPNWWKTLSPEEYDEECKRRSERMTGEGNPMYGKTGEDCPSYGKEVKKETRQKISEAKKGVVFTQEHKDNISEAKKGKKQSEETKKKKSLVSKGEDNPNVKITTVVARTIKFLLFYTTLTHQEIADGIPGVTKGIVDHISQGNSWKDVKLHNVRFYNVED
jgi:hypothetical protein